MLRARREVMVAAACAILGLAAAGAQAQTLRFVIGHRDLGPPDYYSFSIGSMYSSLKFTQTVGVRYTDGTINAVDVLTGAQRGEIKQNGFECPLTSTLTMRNYVAICRYADLDATIWASYEYFPLDTQEDRFTANITDPQFLADIGTSFSFELFAFSYLKVGIRDSPAYMVSYVDPRGIEDQYGGMRYNRFQNDAVLDLDWLLQRDMNLAVSVGRMDVWSPSKHFENQDQTTHRGSVAYQWQLSPLLMIGTRADASEARYTSASRGRYRSYGFSVFSEAEPVRMCTVSAGVGYSRADVSATNDISQGTGKGTPTAYLSLNAELARDLTWTLSLRRSQQSGFESGAETADSVSSGLRWQGKSLALGLSTAFSEVAISGLDASGYSDWSTVFTASYPLTAAALLTFSSAYSIRDNAAAADAGTSGATSSQLSGDYSTWVNGLKLGMALTRRIDMTAYVDYVTRDSDRSSLEYERFTAGVNLGYTYEF